MDLNGSQTEKNLIIAFEGESKARNKYTYFASKAKKEGLEEIAEIFLETANNEKEHAKIWFKLLNGGEINNTINNLKNSIETEKYEAEIMYKKFSDTAKKEGFEDVARLFSLICEIEKSHQERYEKLLNKLETKIMFEKDEDVVWECKNCGYHIKGKKAPKECPFCKHPQAYFIAEE